MRKRVRVERPAVGSFLRRSSKLARASRTVGFFSPRTPPGGEEKGRMDNDHILNVGPRNFRSWHWLEVSTWEGGPFRLTVLCCGNGEREHRCLGCLSSVPAPNSQAFRRMYTGLHWVSRHAEAARIAAVHVGFEMDPIRPKKLTPHPSTSSWRAVIGFRGPSRFRCGQRSTLGSVEFPPHREPTVRASITAPYALALPGSALTSFAFRLLRRSFGPPSPPRRCCAATSGCRARRGRG